MSDVKPEIVTHPRAMTDVVRAAQVSGKSVGLVPTMGALHAGHLSLVQRSCEDCDVTVVTIFVNPTQFGPGEDFDAYPRTLEGDVEQLAGLGVQYVFAPAADMIYQPSHSTYVEPPSVAERLEGKCRPGHFRGVCTIVLKLFNMIPANTAYFGRKDFQQALVIRQMAAELNIPMNVETCPTVRDADGLALSSRNAYLTADERATALAIPEALQAADEMVKQGQHSPEQVEQHMREILTRAGIDQIDYAALADPDTLAPIERLDGPVVALVAAKVGQTRLIDNRVIE